MSNFATPRGTRVSVYGHKLIALLNNAFYYSPLLPPPPLLPRKRQGSLGESQRGLNLGLHYTRRSVTRLKYFVLVRSLPTSFISVSLFRARAPLPPPPSSRVSLFHASSARSRPASLSLHFAWTSRIKDHPRPRYLRARRTR